MHVWMPTQAAVLLCQSMWGPRWFVPKRFLPAKYDYHRPVVPREVAEGALDSSSGPADVETGDGGTFTLWLCICCDCSYSVAHCAWLRFRAEAATS